MNDESCEELMLLRRFRDKAYQSIIETSVQKKKKINILNSKVHNYTHNYINIFIYSLSFEITSFYR